MIVPATTTEYLEPTAAGMAAGLEFLRTLRSRDLRRMASPLLRATTVGEAGTWSLKALTAIDDVLLERELAAA